MNYNIKCDKCNKIEKYSSKNASKYKKGNTLMFSFDCTSCKEEIIVERLLKIR